MPRDGEGVNSSGGAPEMPDWNTVFPELSWIQDDDLRNRTASTWEEAFKLGGWKEDDIDNIPFTLLVSAEGVNLIQHTRIVTNICRSVAEQMETMGGYTIDLDHLISSGLKILSS